ncbi:COPII coat complex component Sec24 E (Sec24E) [Carpediemonas membranifera]|uniref:COPII coat complex component Sec24 E (Sec24E) n=1 Tax=Carpediemonas membranifera TaxID=201153 RepID=A0A8J6DYY3_9EUKA|nr:COPII coat complex component Sec24 E (Sec24E) [Carpediemonas membranifera]|eukprot:KAG9389726.1 COPII coat complex component Sec24 E (Sec24E) [Carpediemonas membranifera]
MLSAPVFEEQQTAQNAPAPVPTATNNAQAPQQAFSQPPPPTVDTKPVGEHLRLTNRCIGNSSSMMSKWPVPFGAVARPLAPMAKPVPVINFNDISPVRCSNCRSYVNCYTPFVDHGSRWKCLFCGTINKTPDRYYQPLDSNGRRIDAENRPELANGVYELAAPEPYMVRPPQPPVYTFVLDVSDPAIKTGLVTAVCSTLKFNLTRMAQDTRILVSFITFDSAVQFWRFPPHTETAHEIVEPVTAGAPFIPMPLQGDLIVNLAENLDKICGFLDMLPHRFSEARAEPSGAFGPAITSAVRSIMTYGGRALYFLASLPTMGVGSLTDRESAGKLNIDGKGLFSPSNDAYKELATEASQAHVCIDGFHTASTYMDVATLSVLSRLTSGSAEYYPTFLAVRDGRKLSSDVGRVLSRETALEAVFRVRCSAGAKVTRYLGHFFTRQTNLLNMANADADSAVGLEIAVEDTIMARAIYVQTALLYTTMSGERRVRVCTVPMQTTAETSDLFQTADMDTILCLEAKKAADKLADGAKIEEVRKDIDRRCQHTLALYTSTAPNPSPNQTLVLPETMRLYPLFSLALLKTSMVRMSAHAKADERAFVLSVLLSKPVGMVRSIIYPSCYCVDAQSDRLSLARLSIESIKPDQIYIIEDNHAIYVFVGRGVSTEVGMEAFEQFDPNDNKLALKLRTDTHAGKRIMDGLTLLRNRRVSEIPYFIVRQDGPLQRHFSELMLESSVNGQSYNEFVAYLQKSISA